MAMDLYGISIDGITKETFDEVTGLLEEKQLEYETWCNNG